MSRTNRMLGGLVFGYGNQVVLTLVGLWLTRFLLARLGQSDYGLWLVGTRVLGYLLLLDVGVVVLLPRETAFATGRAGSIAAATEHFGSFGAYVDQGLGVDDGLALGQRHHQPFGTAHDGARQMQAGRGFTATRQDERP